MSQQLSKKKLAQFRLWLPTQGAIVLPLKSESEVIRFFCDGVTSIIHKNPRGQWTNFEGDAIAAQKAFCKGRPWRRGAQGTKTPKPVQRAAFVRELIGRDGLACFYCPDPLFEHELTIEHLCPRRFKGPNHITNMVLAHPWCNVEAGELPIIEKVKIRERNYSCIRFEVVIVNEGNRS